jgi:hypothetical protein
MPDLRTSLQRICSEWNEAKQTPFAGNPLAAFVRIEFAESVRSALKGFHSGFEIKGSPGQGAWANVPWLSIIDPNVARNTMEGFYVVYLFCGDGSGVYLSLNQGVMGPKNRLGSKRALEHAREVKSAFRTRLPLEEWSESIDLKSKTTLGLSYEEPNIGAKFYPTESIPSQQILESDLLSILEIASNAVPIWRDQQSRFQRGANPSNELIRDPFFPKPFIILAGPSGTGKSRWVRQQAFLTWNGEEMSIPPSNFQLIPVKPNWHDSFELLGYVTRLGLRGDRKAKYVTTEFVKFMVRAWKSPQVPHWLCLDEMNLAPVEQYFAEYLSVIESRRVDVVNAVVSTDPIIGSSAFGELFESENREDDSPEWADFCRDVGLKVNSDLAKNFKVNGISIPQNLIVVGTVNMDETTHSFSRKVLDRAFVWEMPIGDLSSGWTKLAYPESHLEWEPLLATEGAEAKDQLGELDAEWGGRKSIVDAVVAWLENVNRALEGSPFQVSFRVRDELLLLALARGVKSVDKLRETLDDGLYSKILPRIEGDEVRTRKALIGLVALLTKDANLTEAKGWTEIVKSIETGDVSYDLLRQGLSGPGFMFEGDTWKSDPFAPALPWRRSLNKIRSMLLKLEGQFTSYWD